MWRPTVLGVVVAERRLVLTRASRRSAKVVIRIGTPVRSPRAEKRDPWWCPVAVDGLGPPTVRAVAGEDSLQSLMLALEFAGNVLPLEAERSGGHLEWYGERYRFVFADSMVRGLVDRGLQAMSEGLADAVADLESVGTHLGAPAAKRVAEYKTLVASGGQARTTKSQRPSNTRLQPTTPRVGEAPRLKRQR